MHFLESTGREPLLTLEGISCPTGLYWSLEFYAHCRNLHVLNAMRLLSILRL